MIDRLLQCLEVVNSFNLFLVLPGLREIGRKLAAGRVAILRALLADQAWDLLRRAGGTVAVVFAPRRKNEHSLWRFPLLTTYDAKLPPCGAAPLISLVKYD